MSAQTVQPASIVIATFAGSSWSIADVQAISSVDSRVRMIRIYPACGTYHVTAKELVLEDVPVAKLAEKADLCIGDAELSRIIKPLTKEVKDDEEDYNKLSVATQCGSQFVVHHLLPRERLRFEVLARKFPRIATLWELEDIVQLKYKNAEGEEVADAKSTTPNQSVRELAASDVRAGKYDLALAELPDIPLLQTEREQGKLKLSEIIPSPEEATGPETDFAEIENSDQIGLEQKPSPIPYPQIARIAHIQGNVNAEISVDAGSGRVLSVTATGHPILRQGALDAINKWVFVHPYFGPNPTSVVVKFKVRCAVMLDSSATQAAKNSKKRKRKIKH